MKANIIYGLADSRNDLIYYVGKSTVGSKRATSHLTNSHSPEVREWVKSVEANWGHINVVLIEEVEDILLLAERERYWIGVQKIANDDLLNKKDLPHLIDSYTDDDNIQFSQFKNAIYFAGDIIKRRRLALKVSQAELAEKAGLNRWTIGKIEDGGSVSLDSIRKIAMGLTKIGIDKQVVCANITKRTRRNKN